MVPFIPSYIQQIIIFIGKHWIFDRDELMNQPSIGFNDEEYQVNDAQILYHAILIWILQKNMKKITLNTKQQLKQN